MARRAEQPVEEFDLLGGELEDAATEEADRAKADDRTEETPRAPEKGDRFKLGDKEANVIGFHEGKALVRIEGEKFVQAMSSTELQHRRTRADATDKAVKRFDQTARAASLHVADESMRHAVVAGLKERKDEIVLEAGGDTAPDVEKSLLKVVQGEAKFQASVEEARGEASAIFQEVMENLGERGKSIKDLAGMFEADLDDMLKDAEFWAQRKDMSVSEALRHVAKIEALSILHSPEAIDEKAERLQSIAKDLQKQRDLLERAESYLEEGTEAERAKFLGGINKTLTAIVRLAKEMAHAYVRLHPGADRESVESVVQETAGNRVILGS